MALEPRAYLIGGHGSELDTYFTVPDGCTIVVNMTIGKLNNLKKYNKAVQTLCTFDTKTLLDPEKYSNTLIKNIGSVAIYKSGEQCPSFEYSFAACFNKYCMLKLGLSDITSSSICEAYSGISANIVKYMKESSKAFSAASINDTTMIEFISNLYDMSIYPTKEEVQIILNTIKVPAELSGNERLTYYLENLESHPSLNISQEELCKIKPGVYYNFVCRQKEDVLPTNLNSVNSLRPTRTNAVGKILKGRISEAITKRKPYIKKYESSTTEHEMTDAMLRNAGWNVEKKVREIEYNNEGNEIPTNNNANTVSYMYTLETNVRPKNNSGINMSNDDLRNQGWKVYNDGVFVKRQRTRPTYKVKLRGGRTRKNRRRA